MEKTIRKCDKCGKDISNSIWETLIPFYMIGSRIGISGREYDLCKECLEIFNHWLDKKVRQK